MVRVVAKNDPNKASHVKFHANNGYARVAVISALPVGIQPKPPHTGNALEMKVRDGEGAGKKRVAQRESSSSSSLWSSSDEARPQDEECFWKRKGFWDGARTGLNKIQNGTEGYKS